MIQLENITKRFNNRAVVQELTLSCPGGKTTVLVGPSGCGKTTTLEMMNGLLQPDEGKVIVGDVILTDKNVLEMRRRMGYVIQSAGLFPHYTIFENIAVVPKMLKWNSHKIQRRVEEMMQLVDLPIERLNDYSANLSGGQQQRVGFARALAADPEYLLLDEPFSALDPITKSSLRKQFGEIQQRLGKTVVLVTHDMREALELGDRIAVMSEGRMLQNATPQQLLSESQNDFVEEFIGADKHMRLLQITSIAELLKNRKGEPVPSEEGHGSRISAEDSLYSAMNQLIAQAPLPLVVHHNETDISLLKLDDILHFMRKED